MPTDIWAHMNAYNQANQGQKAPAQAAGLAAGGRYEAARAQAEGKIQVASIEEAGKNTRAANQLSALQAYRQKQMEMREASQERIAANQERQRSIQRSKAVSKAGKTVLEANPIINLHDRIAGLPTPGGLGTLFMVLLTLVFVIVAVNQGQTRLSLFWLTLLGRTTLDTSASGDSGPPTSSTSGATGGSVPTQATLAQTAQPGAGSTVPATANRNTNGLPNVKLPGR